MFTVNKAMDHSIAQKEYYLDEVDTLDDVDTELEVDTLKGIIVEYCL